MKKEIREEERVVKDKYTVYIAENGKEFNDERDCMRYENELRVRENNNKVDKYRDRDLDDMIPIHYDDSFSSFNSYIWFKLNNKEEFTDLDEVFESRCDEPKSYPSYICIECEGNYEDRGWDTDYSYTLDESMKITKEYFKNFGIEVEFKRK